MSFLSVFGSRPSSAGTDAARRPAQPARLSQFRPGLEEFEDRIVPAAPAFEGPALVADAAAASISVDHGAQAAAEVGAQAAAEVGAQAAVQQAVARNLLDGLNLGNVTVQSVDLGDVSYDAATGVVTATGGTVSGLIGGLPFTTDITNFSLQTVADDPSTTPTECSVLNLQLAPIDLDLLGLNVNTSPICLDITAIQGGGLLGDLLCGLAGGNLDLLQNGGLANLTGGLSDVLSQTLTGALQQAGPADQADPLVEDICDGECEVLDLAVGPLDLTVLGLNVHLDDCEGGPVQVCVSASADGGILGSLLCGLVDGGLLGRIDRILDRIDRIVGRIEDRLDKIVNRLEDRIDKIADRIDRQLDRLEDRLDTVADRLDNVFDGIDLAGNGNGNGHGHGLGRGRG